MNESRGHTPASSAPVQGQSRPAIRSPSLALAWAITAGEGLLWSVMAWFFADYWLMLPVRYRWMGGLGLASLATVGLLRMILFYRRRRRNPPNP